MKPQPTRHRPTGAAAKPDEKGPPLPLHQIEGNGGIFATLSAYIVNPRATASRLDAQRRLCLLNSAP